MPVLSQRKTSEQQLNVKRATTATRKLSNLLQSAFNC